MHRGTRFTLSRDELLTLPEFVLLSLFPNGLFPEGHMGFGDGEAVQVDVGAPRSSHVTSLEGIGGDDARHGQALFACAGNQDF